LSGVVAVAVAVAVVIVIVIPAVICIASRGLTRILLHYTSEQNRWS